MGAWSGMALASTSFIPRNAAFLAGKRNPNNYEFRCSWFGAVMVCARGSSHAHVRMRVCSVEVNAVVRCLYVRVTDESMLN